MIKNRPPPFLNPKRSKTITAVVSNSKFPQVTLSSQDKITNCQFCMKLADNY